MSGRPILEVTPGVALLSHERAAEAVNRVLLWELDPAGEECREIVYGSNPGIFCVVLRLRGDRVPVCVVLANKTPYDDAPFTLWAPLFETMTTRAQTADEVRKAVNQYLARAWQALG